MQGMNVKVATPVGYDPDASVVQYAKRLAETNRVTLTMTRDPIDSVSGADVIVTDTWIRYTPNHKLSFIQLFSISVSIAIYAPSNFMY
jgi:ornithine carbamoyltransferase